MRKSKLAKVLPYNDLCKLVHEGKTDGQIAEMFNCTRGTVQAYRRSLGIAKERNPEKYDYDMIQRMLECNLTYDDIAHIYGTTYKAVINFMYRKRKEMEEETVV